MSSWSGKFFNFIPTGSMSSNGISGIEMGIAWTWHVFFRRAWGAWWWVASENLVKNEFNIGNQTLKKFHNLIYLSRSSLLQMSLLKNPMAISFLTTAPHPVVPSMYLLAWAHAASTFPRRCEVPLVWIFSNSSSIEAAPGGPPLMILSTSQASKQWNSSQEL